MSQPTCTNGKCGEGVVILYWHKLHSNMERVTRVLPFLAAQTTCTNGKCGEVLSFLRGTTNIYSSIAKSLDNFSKNHFFKDCNQNFYDRMLKIGTVVLYYVVHHM